jgi:hypothetical protein
MSIAPASAALTNARFSWTSAQKSDEAISGQSARKSISGNPEGERSGAVTDFSCGSGLSLDIFELPQVLNSNRRSGRMDTNGEVRQEPAVETKGVGALAIAALTADLKALVDQLETDWSERLMVRQETAAQIHELRERAERLFDDRE